MSDIPYRAEALEVKHVMSRMFAEGVSGSEHNPSVRSVSPRLSLERVLDYTSFTKRLRDSLAQMLLMANLNETEWEKHIKKLSEVDFIFSLEQDGQLAVFSMNDRFLVENRRRFSAAVLVSITKDMRRFGGLWKVNFLYLPGDLSGDDLQANDIRPERNTLVQFWFSPERLDQESVLSTMSLQSTMRPYIFNGVSFDFRGFRTFQYNFFGNGYAKEIRKRGLFGQATIPLALLAEERGDYRFSVVELGATQIGRKLTWIYSASERIERFVD